MFLPHDSAIPSTMTYVPKRNIFIQRLLYVVCSLILFVFSHKLATAQVSTSRWRYKTYVVYPHTVCNSYKRNELKDICNVDLKIIMLSESSPTRRICILWLFTYNLKKCKLIETKVISCWGIQVRELTMENETTGYDSVLPLQGVWIDPWSRN